MHIVYGTIVNARQNVFHGLAMRDTGWLLEPRYALKDMSQTLSTLVLRDIALVMDALVLMDVVSQPQRKGIPAINAVLNQYLEDLNVLAAMWQMVR